MSRPSQTESTCPDLADLLLASEGELPRRRQNEVTAHLRLCAACREQLGNVGLALREYQEAAGDPSSAHAEADTRRIRLFRGRLGQERKEQAARAVRLPVRSWLPVAAAVPVLVAALFFSSRYTSVVRAEELLNRAAVQEQSTPTGTVRRLQFHIRRQPRAIVRGAQNADQWSFTRDVGNRVAPASATTGGENDNDAELARLLEASHFDWRDPLSVRGLRAWRESLARKTDTVTAFGTDALALRTVTPDGVLRGIELIVRRVDFQPLRQTLDIDGFGQIEIVEVSRWVATAPILADRSASPAPNAAAAPVALSAEMLDEAELDVRAALHDQALDTLPAITLARSSRGIEVRGCLDAQRKADLARALHHVGPVRVLLQPENAPASTEGTLDVNSESAQRWLERTFGRTEQAAAFIQALGADNIHVQQRATAFAALAARYPESETRKLTPSARTKLDVLANAQYTDLVKAVSVLDDRLALFLGTSTRRAPTGSTPQPWQACALAITSQATQLDRAIRELLQEPEFPLSTGMTPGGEEPRALANLRQAANALWQRLHSA